MEEKTNREIIEMLRIAENTREDLENLISGINHEILRRGGIEEVLSLAKQEK